MAIRLVSSVPPTLDNKEILFSDETLETLMFSLRIFVRALRYLGLRNRLSKSSKIGGNHLGYKE